LTLLIKQIFNFIKLLNSDTGTHQIAAGITMGMILGFTPAFSLQTVLVFLCLFFFRVQVGVAFLSALVFAVPAYFLDPVFHRVGMTVLELPNLRPLYTTLYNMPIVPLTRFNNSIVMGSGVIALALAPICFPIVSKLVQLYREKIIVRFENTRLWKAAKASSLYKWYVKYEELRG